MKLLFYGTQLLLVLAGTASCFNGKMIEGLLFFVLVTLRDVEAAIAAQSDSKILVPKA